MWIYIETITLLFLISLSLTSLIWWCFLPEKWLLWCKMVIFLIPSFLLHLLALYYYLWTQETVLHSVSYIPFSSVAQLCPTLCNPMNRSTPGLPVHHQLPEFTQTHVHRIGDAIQPSHPLSSPSPPALNPSQHQSLFQWVNSLHEVAKVLEFQL